LDLRTFIIAVFCLVDDRLKGRRIRQRGPAIPAFLRFSREGAFVNPQRQDLPG
jgi:hypothetical protein